MNKINVLLCALLCIQSANVTAQNRLNETRISWDKTSKVEVGGGGYARVKELQNGEQLLVLSQGKNIFAIHSTNQGQTWGARIQVGQPANSGVGNTNAEAIQLSDGTVIVGWNQRADRTNTNPEYRFAIQCAISKDNGYTFGNTITIFEGSYLWDEGCWEPFFLELPNGDVQCYFADETNHTSDDYQDIVCFTSKDKGQTWSDRRVVSYRYGHRDGMPTAILSEDKQSILAAIEDNGTVYSNHFRPAIVRTSVADSWASGFVSGDSDRRNITLDGVMKGDYLDGVYFGANCDGGAPYICRLSTGDVAVSCQSSAGGRDINYMELTILVGDKDGRNFKTLYQPFQTASTHATLWNSLTTLSNGDLLACTTYDNSTIMLMRGKPYNAIHANYCPIYIDGKFNRQAEKWYDKNGEQLILGQENDIKWVADFSYSKHYLNMYVRAVDQDQVSTKAAGQNDGIRLLIDAKNECGDKPTVNSWNILCDIAGNVIVKRGDGSSWTKIDTPRHLFTKTACTSTAYVMEVAIPWEMLGVTPATQQIGLAVERFNRTKDGFKEDGIKHCETFQPYTWLPLILGAMPADVKDRDDIFDYDDTESALPVVNQSAMLDYNAPCYDLLGRAVNNPSSGIVIQNGLKYLIK